MIMGMVGTIKVNSGMEVIFTENYTELVYLIKNQKKTSKLIAL